VGGGKGKNAMIVTILEGHVPSNRWNDFENSYREIIKHLPVQLKETFLIQDEHDPTLWRVISVWKSREDYDVIKFDPLYHSCSELYRSVGVESTRRTFNVVAHHTHV
jgi:quinol monooxygenase YgiN